MNISWQIQLRVTKIIRRRSYKSRAEVSWLKADATSRPGKGRAYQAGKKVKVGEKGGIDIDKRQLKQ